MASRNLVKGHPVCPFHHQSLIVPHGRWARISLRLLFVRYARPFLKAGVGISSTEVAGEAVLAVSVPKTMGVMDSIGVTEGPFPMMRTVLFPMLDDGSSFFDLIFSYMSLLNLVVISTKRKTLVKKKKTQVYTRESILTNLTLTLFFLNINVVQDKGRRLWTKTIEGESPWVHQIVLVLNRFHVFNCLLLLLFIPALKLGSSLNCTKQGMKEVVIVKVNATKLKQRKEIMTHLRLGFPTNEATSGDHPKPRRRESQNCPRTQRKTWTSNT